MNGSIVYVYVSPHHRIGICFSFLEEISFFQKLHNMVLYKTHTVNFEVQYRASMLLGKLVLILIT